MTINWRHPALTFLAGLALASCSNGPSAPNSPSPSGAQNSNNPLTALGSPDVPIFNVSDAETSDGRGPCVFDSSTGQFDCPDRTRDGITFTMRFTLYDAQGNVQSRFDRATTASIRTETAATGTTTRQDATITINRSGVMTTTGLGPGATTHVLNGTEQGTVQMSTSHNGMTVTTNTSIDDTTTNLVVPVRTADRDRGYPLSGVRVHATVSTTPRGAESRTVTTRRQETFDGTNIVQVEVTVNGVTQHCTFDLAAKTSTCGRR